MNKFIKSLPFTLIAILAFYSLSHAGKVNNGAGVQGAFGKMLFGVEYDTISSQDMKFNGGLSIAPGEVALFPEPPDLPGDPATTISGGRFEATHTLLSGSIGLASWVDLLLKLGFTNSELTYQINDPVAGAEEVAFDGDLGLAYGIGLKAAVGDLYGYQLYSSLQLFFSDVDGNYRAPGHGAETTKARFEETQVSFFAAKDVGFWTPYGGLKFSKSTLEIDRSTPAVPPPGGVNTHEEHESDGNIGLFIGTDVVVVPGVNANIEFRFVDESALSLGLSWVF
jgi:hypothetical protein